MCRDFQVQKRPIDGDAPPNWPWTWINPDVHADDADPLILSSLKLLKESLNLFEKFLRDDEYLALPIYQCIALGLTNYGWFGGSSGYLKQKAGYALAVEAGSALQILLALYRLVAHPPTLSRYKTTEYPPLTGPIAFANYQRGS